jgi:hypothetical protein
MPIEKFVKHMPVIQTHVGLIIILTQLVKAEIAENAVFIKITQTAVKLKN